MVHRPASRPGQDLPSPESISAWEGRTEISSFEAKSECSDEGGVRLGSAEIKQVCTALSGICACACAFRYDILSYYYGLGSQVTA